MAMQRAPVIIIMAPVRSAFMKRRYTGNRPQCSMSPYSNDGGSNEVGDSGAEGLRSTMPKYRTEFTLIEIVMARNMDGITLTALDL